MTSPIFTFGAAVKVAVTLFAPVIETVQVPVPRQSDQPVKSEVGLAGCGVEQHGLAIGIIVAAECPAEDGADIAADRTASGSVH